MKLNRLLHVGVTVALLVLAMAGLSSAREPAPEVSSFSPGFTSGGARALDASTPLGTAFTYQGYLTRNGQPVSATCDFQFGLWDDPVSGSQVGSTYPAAGIPLDDGRFTVALDFGDVFDGTALWLAVAVQCPGDGLFVLLPDRQPLTAAPYAAYALSAGEALTATSAATLGGLPASAFQQRTESVLVVAKSGGDFTSIQAALDAITGTLGNRYLVWVAPGTYTETVTMERYVDIEGAGEGATRIVATGGVTVTDATVTGASSAELRFLTVENTGDDRYAVAMYNSTAPRLTHVTLVAAGATGNFPISIGYNVGIYNTSVEYPYAVAELNDVTIRVRSAGSTMAYGVWNHYAAPRLKDVTLDVRATGGFDGGVGVYNEYAWPVLESVRIDGLGGDYASVYGLLNKYSAPVATDLVATIAVGGAMGGSTGYGIYNDHSSCTLSDSSLSVTGQGSFAFSYAYGLGNVASSGAYTVTVHGSEIAASSNTISSDAEYAVQVGASQLAGGPISAGGGTVRCAGVYDEAFTHYASSCPP
jgi:hypothetical protein